MSPVTCFRWSCHVSDLGRFRATRPVFGPVRPARTVAWPPWAAGRRTTASTPAPPRRLASVCGGAPSSQGAGRGGEPAPRTARARRIVRVKERSPSKTGFLWSGWPDLNRRPLDPQALSYFSLQFHLVSVGASLTL